MTVEHGRVMDQSESTSKTLSHLLVFSADSLLPARSPYFAGEAVRETVRGIQEQGNTANVKHFFASKRLFDSYRPAIDSSPTDEQEYLRTGNPSGTYLISQANYTISSEVDDSTAHELYVYPFAEAVRAGAGSIMCS